MELVIILGLVGGFLYLKSQEQRERITLLSGQLGRFELEKLMESLMEGYMRALGEASDERKAQVLGHLNPQEEKLSQQFAEFSKAFKEVWADSALVSTLPIGFPWAVKLFPKATFDLRKAFSIHAQGIESAVANAHNATAPQRAFILTAEMMLMQHTCHWFCRSKTVASARLLKRHQTSYDQVLGAVSGSTRQAYERLVGG